MCLFGVAAGELSQKGRGETEAGGLVSWAGGGGCLWGEWCGTSDLACCFQSIVFLY